MRVYNKYPITDSVLRWLETILAERFGHTWHLSRGEHHFILRLGGAEGTIVFDSMQDYFTEARSDLPFSQWDAVHESWQSVLGGPLPAPGVADLPTPLIESRRAEYVIHYDIFGLIYWMLARVEEIGRTDLDKHGRFPATSSHALKHGYLDHPVVDEWLHVLGQVIQRHWPGVVIKRHAYQMQLSHDVDRPSRYGFASTINLLRRMVGDFSRGDLFYALAGPWVRLNTKLSLQPVDPFNTFNWIMDQSEKHGVTSAFYFICGCTCDKLDAEYDIEHPAIRKLLRQIYNRGHEIGLHPSYNTYKDPAALKFEADQLRRICSEEGIQQDAWGGRMHYLRWAQPATLRAWSDAGMTYDSTLGYADHAGFRCGTCFDYAGFDATQSEILSVRVRPLILMEVSLFCDSYMRINQASDAIDIISNMKNTCKLIGGNFTLLWHNSDLFSHTKKGIYNTIF